MNQIQRDIHYLPYEALVDPHTLIEIYADMDSNYYWSDDFSPMYYIAQARAGFIAVTETYQDQELLLPEIQYRYALLDLQQLHCSKKVAKLLRKKELNIVIDENLEEIAELIAKHHKHSWLSEQYIQTLRSTHGISKDFKVITAYIEEQGEIVAGEIGYLIANTYTSLSGFSLKEKAYNHFGTAQLVLLGRYLQTLGITHWSLGHVMSYKLALGAKVYEREAFLKQWLTHSSV